VVKAFGDLGVSAGGDTDYNEDQYTVIARFDGFAGSVIPISDVHATGWTLQTNEITVNAGAHLMSARDANLFTARFGDTIVKTLAKAESWVSDLSGAILGALGGGALLDYANTDGLFLSHAVVTNDGIVETGFNRHQHLTLGVTGDESRKVPLGWNPA